MGYSLARMTLYALISSIEEDLRTVIRDHLKDASIQSKFLSTTSVQQWTQRYDKDNDRAFEATTIANLIDYFDIADTYQIINSIPDSFPLHISDYIKKNTKVFEKIVPIRNRVMHIRPLAFEDTSYVIEFCKKAIFEEKEIWINVKHVVDKIEGNPSFVLDLEIPIAEDEVTTAHNLPLPDFDETGLIGREEQLAKLKKLCFGPYPVISIVGEGGIGKSALALKVAYELLEEKDNPFDAIIWVSSKTTQITSSEIREIKGAITSSLGVFNEISEQLSGQRTENALEEIIEYLESFRIVLFIDNLETILDAKVRDFMESLPFGSKVIITSRIGLGAFEFPVKLVGIDESHASQLLRMLAKSRDITSLASLPELVLKKFCQRMHCNPAYIKWFVSTIQTGRTPEQVLQNSEKFLEFCMSNVYGYLSNGARNFMETMQCAPGWKDIAEIAYLGDILAIDAQRSLQELMTTHMISESSRVSGSSVRTIYQLSELARSFLNKTHKPSDKTQDRVKNNRNKLTAIIESNAYNNVDRYSQYSISIRSKSDRVIAKKLYDCLELIKSQNYSPVVDILDEATRLAPDYFEVPRIKALLNIKTGNIADARENYELAINLAPENSQILHWYSIFLSRHEDSIDEAVVASEKAHKMDKAPVLVLELARLYLYQKKFDKSLFLLRSLDSLTASLQHTLLLKYYDLRIQLDYRQADNYCDSKMYEKTIIHLVLMKSAFDTIPKQLVDRRIIEKVRKCRHTLEVLNASKLAENDAILVRDLMKWEFQVTKSL
jgi:LuxR family transcriptional regulator, glucitol operon activator